MKKFKKEKPKNSKDAKLSLESWLGETVCSPEVSYFKVTCICGYGKGKTNKIADSELTFFSESKHRKSRADFKLTFNVI